MSKHTRSGPKYRTKGLGFASIDDLKAATVSECRVWFRTEFGVDWDETRWHWLRPDGEPGERRASDALLEREARKQLVTLYDAMRAAEEWADAHPDGDGLEVRFLRDHFPPRGSRDVYPSLRAWTDRHRRGVRVRPEGERAWDLAARRDALAGVPWFVACVDDRDVFGRGVHDEDSLRAAGRYSEEEIARLRGATRFLTDSEIAKLAMLCGYFPEHASVEEMSTTGKYIALMAQIVKNARRSVGQLRSAKDKERMGVAGRRGPKAKI